MKSNGWETVEVDTNRKWIALSMKENSPKPAEREKRENLNQAKPKPFVTKKVVVQEPESDLQIKLAALKDKFR